MPALKKALVLKELYLVRHGEHAVTDLNVYEEAVSSASSKQHGACAAVVSSAAFLYKLSYRAKVLPFSSYSDRRPLRFIR
jgi:hypothetical protein